MNIYIHKFHLQPIVENYLPTLKVHSFPAYSAKNLSSKKMSTILASVHLVSLYTSVSIKEESKTLRKKESYEKLSLAMIHTNSFYWFCTGVSSASVHLQFFLVWRGIIFSDGMYSNGNLHGFLN